MATFWKIRFSILGRGKIF